MKTLARQPSQIGHVRLLALGPRGSPTRWLETVGCMTECHSQRCFRIQNTFASL